MFRIVRATKRGLLTSEEDLLIPSDAPLELQDCLEIHIYWTADIIARHSSVDIPFQFMSNDPEQLFETFLSSLNEKYPDCCVLDSHFRAFDIDSLYKNPAKNVVWNLMASHARYSDILIPQVAKHVEFESIPQSTQKVLETFRENLKRKVNSQKEQLMKDGKVAEAAAISEPIEERTKRFKAAIEANHADQVRWDEFVNITHQRLESIHMTFPPSEKLSEAARRVIIDQFVLSVCHYMKTIWEVECIVPKDTSERQIGWGKLDYKFGKDVLAIIKAVVEDATELNVPEKEKEEEEQEEVTGKEGQEFEKGEELSSPGKVGVTSSASITEAKEKLDDQACAQVTAQQHDLVVLEAKSMTRGILSTGTTWDFFQLTANGPHGKPVLSYEGGKQLKIVKAETIATASSVGRRPSALLGESVSREEVNAIMIALASSMCAL